MSEFGQWGERKKRKQILRQPCLLCFPYPSLTWVFSLFCQPPRSKSPAWLGPLAALASSPISLLPPCPATPFQSACHIRVRGIFQKEIQVLRLPCLQSYQSISHHQLGGDRNAQLWCRVVVCGRHCTPRSPQLGRRDHPQLPRVSPAWALGCPWL